MLAHLTHRPAEDTALTDPPESGAESPHGHPSTPTKRKSSSTEPLPATPKKAHKGMLLLLHNTVPCITCVTVTNLANTCRDHASTASCNQLC